MFVRNVRNALMNSQRASRYGLVLMVAAALSLASATSSVAAVLSPGGILYPAPSGPLNAGTLIDSLVIPFVSPTYTGSLTSLVYASDPTNPLGGVTFVYQISNTSPFPGEIDRLTVNNFSGFLTDSHYSTATGVLPPTYIDRSVGSGETVGFSFAKVPIGPGSLQPGQTSNVLIVYTDAPFYEQTIASVIDGSVAQVPSFAPTRVIPEPSTLALAGLAAVGGLLLRKRRW